MFAVFNFPYVLIITRYPRDVYLGGGNAVDVRSGSSTGVIL